METDKIQSEQIYYRSFEIRKEDVNKENRSIELSFSSGNEIEKWFGLEILDHKKESVDLSRLNSSAALLLNHDTDKHSFPRKSKKEERWYASPARISEKKYIRMSWTASAKMPRWDTG
jgi:hypothetical protein